MSIIGLLLYASLSKATYLASNITYCDSGIKDSGVAVILKGHILSVSEVGYFGSTPVGDTFVNVLRDGPEDQCFVHVTSLSASEDVIDITIDLNTGDATVHALKIENKDLTSRASKISCNTDVLKEWYAGCRDQKQKIKKSSRS